jgi:hypothetical protein
MLSSVCNRGSYNQEIWKDCETSFRQCGVTDEKTSRGCIHTAAFRRRSSCVDAITGDGAVCKAEMNVQEEAKPNEGMPTRD